MDLIKPYRCVLRMALSSDSGSLNLTFPRLEMNAKLGNSKGKDLYAYWRATITEHLNNELAGGDCLLIPV